MPQVQRPEVIRSIYALLSEKKTPLKAIDIFNTLHLRNELEAVNYRSFISALHAYVKYWKGIGLIKKVKNGYYGLNDSIPSLPILRKSGEQINDNEILVRIKLIHINMLRKLLLEIPDLSANIKDRDFNIFIDIFFDQQKYQFVAKKYNLSQDRIKQIFKQTYEDVIPQIAMEFKKFSQVHNLVSQLRSRIIELESQVDSFKNQDYKLPKHPVSSDIKDPFLTPLSEVDFSARTKKVLKELKIETIGDLVKIPSQQLLSFKNFGLSSMLDLKLELARFNIDY